MIKKKLILSDLHLTENSTLTLQKRKEKLFSFLKEFIQENENEIDSIVFLGDTIHEKRFIFSKAIFFLKDLFETFKKKDFYLIVGNHDFFDSRKFSPLRVFESSNVFVIYEPFIESFYSKKILYYPYEKNPKKIKEDFRKFSKDEQLDFVLTHLDFKGFFLNLWKKNFEFGLDLAEFDFFEKTKIVSGHYHLFQEKENVIYVGSTIFLDFKDVIEIDLSQRTIKGERKRFFLLDVEDSDFLRPIYLSKRIDFFDQSEIDFEIDLGSNVVVIYDDENEIKKNRNFLSKIENFELNQVRFRRRMVSKNSKKSSIKNYLSDFSETDYKLSEIEVVKKFLRTSIAKSEIYNLKIDEDFVIKKIKELLDLFSNKKTFA